MIRNVKLNNFKSINLSERLKLNSLNLLCGANSSGKSSLIQSILMLSQTFGSRFSHKSVALNGHLVKLGGFDDIKCCSNTDENIIISFCVDGDENSFDTSIQSVDIEIEFGFTKSNDTILKEQLDPPLLKSKISVTYINDDGKTHTSKIHIERSTNENDDDSYEYRVTNYEGDYFSDMLSTYPSSKVIGCSVSSFIPQDIYIEYDHGRLLSDGMVDNLTSLGRRNYKNLRPSRIAKSDMLPRAIFEFIVARIDKENEIKKKRMQLNIQENKEHILKSFGINFENKVDLDLLISILASRDISPNSDEIKNKFLSKDNVDINEWHAYCNSMELKNRDELFSFIRLIRFELANHIHDVLGYDIKKTVIRFDLLQNVHFFLSNKFINGVKYLGPLRSDPKSIYPITNLIDPYDVGIKGENAAAVFHINKNRELNVPLPESFMKDKSKNFDIYIGISKFSDSVISWLNYMGVIENLSTVDKGKFGYELKVKTTDGDGLQDLTHVGVGVSQVIPIVMLCLLSNAGDILIFEQPELHLHPKVQARLTDFLIAMSMMNRQVLVETHSEYMINRLRYRIASSSDDLLLNKATVYFVNKVGSKTSFGDVQITKYGAIKEWPNDFFDQTQNEIESIFIAAANKKKSERV